MPLEMQEAIRIKIDALKIDCGEWGKERRYKYLLEKALLIDIEIEILQAEYNPINWRNKAVMLGIINQWQQIQKKIIGELTYMLYPNPKNNQISPEMIARAREYPIDKLIEFNKGKARCISGAHEDKHPSMSIKDNYAHCFSCGYNADSIKVTIQIKNLSFKEAVKWLNL